MTTRAPGGAAWLTEQERAFGLHDDPAAMRRARLSVLAAVGACRAAWERPALLWESARPMEKGDFDADLYNSGRGAYEET